MREKEPSETVADLKHLSALITSNRGRILLEGYGRKYVISGILVVGARTDDPGLVLSIEHTDAERPLYEWKKP